MCHCLDDTMRLLVAKVDMLSAECALKRLWLDTETVVIVIICICWGGTSVQIAQLRGWGAFICLACWFAIAEACTCTAIFYCLTTSVAIDAAPARGVAWHPGITMIAPSLHAASVLVLHILASTPECPEPEAGQSTPFGAVHIMAIQIVNVVVHRDVTAALVRVFFFDTDVGAPEMVLLMVTAALTPLEFKKCQSRARGTLDWVTIEVLEVFVNSNTARGFVLGLWGKIASRVAGGVVPDVVIHAVTGFQHELIHDLSGACCRFSDHPAFLSVARKWVPKDTVGTRD